MLNGSSLKRQIQYIASKEPIILLWTIDTVNERLRKLKLIF